MVADQSAEPGERIAHLILQWRGDGEDDLKEAEHHREEDDGPPQRVQHDRVDPPRAPIRFRRNVIGRIKHRPTPRIDGVVVTRGQDRGRSQRPKDVSWARRVSMPTPRLATTGRTGTPSAVDKASTEMPPPRAVNSSVMLSTSRHGRSCRSTWPTRMIERCSVVASATMTIASGSRRRRPRRPAGRPPPARPD